MNSYFNALFGISFILLMGFMGYYFILETEISSSNYEVIQSYTKKYPELQNVVDEIMSDDIIREKEYTRFYKALRRYEKELAKEELRGTHGY